MIDHQPEQPMDSEHAEIAAAGSERLDEVGVPRASRQPISASGESARGVPTEELTAREAVALAGLLAASLPLGEALGRTLTIGLRLLPTVRQLAVYAPTHGEADPYAWSCLAVAERGARSSGGDAAPVTDTRASSGAPAGSAPRATHTRSLHGEIVRRVALERTPFRVDDTTYVPLWFIRTDGTSVRAGGVLVVRRDEGAPPPSPRETTGLALLAPCCAALLARRVPEEVERRVAESLALLPTMQSCLPAPPELSAGTEPAPSIELEELPMLRAAAASIAPLLGASRAWVLLPAAEGTWRAYGVPYSEASRSGPQAKAERAQAPEQDKADGSALDADLLDADLLDADLLDADLLDADLLDADLGQRLVAALGTRDLLAVGRTAPLWVRLRALFADSEPSPPSAPAGLAGNLLLAVRVAGQLAAVIALETLAAWPMSDGTTPELVPSAGLSAERATELNMARTLLALAGATLLALRLSSASDAEDQARDAFLSLTVHELRSPLTAVKGYSQLLIRQARRLGVPEQMGQAVAAIEEQSTRMADMISEMHDAVRIRRGDLELHSEPVDLAPLVAHAVQQQRKLYPQHTIVLAVTDEPLIGEWDPQRLEQVVAALVSNAARFSPGGGDVAVEVTRGVLDGHPAARLCVRDRGVGVAEPDRERIFEYLFRAPEARRRHLSGLGLGLFVSRTLAERMGGRLWLDESHTGEHAGSTFCLLLPLTQTD